MSDIPEAHVIREHVNQKVKEAWALLSEGSVVSNESLTGPDGHAPFPGSLNLFLCQLKEAEDDGDEIDNDTLVRWAEAHTNVWFDGFDNDTRQNRANYMKTLISKLPEKFRTDL